jgi:hypothetical protein
MIRAAVSRARSIMGSWLSIQLDVAEFLSFRLSSSEMPLHFFLENFFRKQLSFVHPCCTIEALPVLPRHRGKFRGRAPNNLQWPLQSPRQIIMGGHQVMRPRARFAEAPLQKFVKQTQSVQAHVRSRSVFAQKAGHCHKAYIPFTSWS